MIKNKILYELCNLAVEASFLDGKNISIVFDYEDQSNKTVKSVLKTVLPEGTEGIVDSFAYEAFCIGKISSFPATKDTLITLKHIAQELYEAIELALENKNKCSCGCGMFIKQ